jgi:hypothetical protein
VLDPDFTGATDGGRDAPKLRLAVGEREGVRVPLDVAWTDGETLALGLREGLLALLRVEDAVAETDGESEGAREGLLLVIAVGGITTSRVGAAEPLAAAEAAALADAAPLALGLALSAAAPAGATVAEADGDREGLVEGPSPPLPPMSAD